MQKRIQTEHTPYYIIRKEMNKLQSLILLLIVSSCTFAQKNILDKYAIGFYNMENLFDTEDDPTKNDDDFTPNGSYNWTEHKYQSKLKNMAQVVSDLGTDYTSKGCAFVGVAEIENAKVLKDLCAQPSLKSKGFKYIHFEGVDKRGIDCALLYNSSLFQVNIKKTKLVPYRPVEPGFKTRGFLTVDGTLAGEHVVVIVCHLPSRLKGDDTGRVVGAQQVDSLKRTLLKTDPTTKIFIMGDMNDDPLDRAMTSKGLHGKEKIDNVKQGDLFNPFISIFKSGTGTLIHEGKWNLFDQILITPNLLNQRNKKDTSTLKYHSSQIFRRDYLVHATGRHKGTPKRTHSGGEWKNGYSDHLPVVMYLTKNSIKSNK